MSFFPFLHVEVWRTTVLLMRPRKEDNSLGENYYDFNKKISSLIFNLNFNEFKK